ncbi:efflux RND transporter periplasmic adaptor subunit [Aestuariibacter halophilus]|uniref:Efflux RND transporter periplasmic adaptor subunit n=1 Tax=Fluctibacter halophilus TaxID=226011 RepID=A0ABS8G832_9ALTE|nr:efflux RND transporter periplasmic adaptor subunit [Aestuariibacter halophilus]MCC2616737.1 efflux RND transporter periplasmic adaptor subunit [Aestuariibacter halophilus]
MKVWLAGIVVIVGIGIWWFGQSPPPQVQGIKVTRGTVLSQVTNTRSGSVEACRRAKLSVPIGGQISDIRVTEGDSVAAGDILLTLFQGDILAQIQQAEAHRIAAGHQSERQCVLSEADGREAKRIARLIDDGLASKEQLDLVQSKAKASAMACKASTADIAQADAQINVLKAQLSKTTLTAPFDGTVAEINGEVGEFATPSPPGIPTLPMVDLIDDHCFYVTAPIDEVDAGQLQLGQAVTIHLDAYRDRPLKGTVRRIAPYVFAMEKQARTVDVEATIGDQSLPLLVGYSADVEILIEQHDDVLVLPTQAIFSDDQVFVVKDGVLQQRTLTLGLSNWQVSEVLSGLVEGEIVVNGSAHGDLAEGMEVSVNIQQAQQ